MNQLTAESFIYSSAVGGVALREPHLNTFLKRLTQFSSFEVIFENYLFNSGERLQNLINLSQDYKIHLHGVSSNIASFDDLNIENFKNLKELINKTNSSLVSDHLCFTRINKKSTFELLPPPKTKKMIDHIGNRVDKIREIIKTDFILENISAYFGFKIDEMSEVEFMNELHAKYGINFLLDVNNLYVNSINLNYSSEDFIKKLSNKSILAYHIAGHEKVENFLFDTHGSDVSPEVSQLLAKAVKKFGKQPVFLERDENIPVELRPLEAEFVKNIEGLAR